MLRALLPLVLCAAFAAQAQDAGGLRTRHAALKDQLANNPFGRALHVDSTVTGGAHKGEIYAVIDKPFSEVSRALARPANWCNVVTLQINVKRCEAPSDDTMSAFITRKARDVVDDAHRVDFSFARASQSADYLHIVLDAPSGPVGTRDYEIRFEAAPLDSRRTFMHMSYAYKLGTMARFAMDAYLAGAGRDKPGFSVEGGERGVVERSAMRYYLAIEAYLESPQNLEPRLRHWYSAIARHPQLHERVGAEEYVAMKRREANS
jgi:hypothetical protein